MYLTRQPTLRVELTRDEIKALRKLVWAAVITLPEQELAFSSLAALLLKMIRAEQKVRPAAEPAVPLQ